MVQSLYSKLYNPAQIAKQRVVERFDGDALDERWTTVDIVGTGSFAMVDIVDEGFQITTGANSLDRSTIWFNDIRHYDFNASRIIFVCRNVVTTTRGWRSGFSRTNDPIGVTDHRAVIEDDTVTGGGVLRLLAGNATSSALANMTTSQNIVFHKYSVETKASSIQGKVDNILEATISSTLPTASMQPVFEVITRAAATRELRIRYCEAYNT